jgi:hypothetical protein
MYHLHWAFPSSWIVIREVVISNAVKATRCQGFQVNFPACLLALCYKALFDPLPHPFIYSSFHDFSLNYITRLSHVDLL